LRDSIRASGKALSQLRKLHTAASSALPGQAITQAKNQLWLANRPIFEQKQDRAEAGSLLG